MINPAVSRICEEYNIAIISGDRIPDIRETRACATLGKLLDKYGEDHFRLVMSTIAETSNNQGHIDEYLIWAVSDLVRSCRSIIEEKPTEWLALWDRIEVGKLQYYARDLVGISRQRDVLCGMFYERIVRAFGPGAAQPDLFDERREHHE